MNLSEFKTCELVKELKTREGIKFTIVEPCMDVEVKISGPAIVIEVVD